MPFGPLGGDITLTPGVMTFNTAGADDFPGATKPLPASLPTVFGMSGRFSFTEYQTPPTANTAYDLFFNNFDLSETLIVALFGDGNLTVQVGDPASAPQYNGIWTPNAGAHVVDFSVDALGVPTLFIDGVSIPLVFFANVPTFASLLPADSVALFLGSGDAAAGSAPVTNVFLTAGVTGPTTDFCCPA